MMIEKYKTSGHFGSGIFLLFAIAVPAMAALGYLYQLVIDWIPYIYATFIATLGLGAAANLTCSFMVKKGKCRNLTLGLLLGLIVSSTAVAASFWTAFTEWQSDVVAVLQTDEEIDYQAIPAIAEELEFMTFIYARVQSGWHIGHNFNSDAESGDISGIFVYLIWFVEAAIVLGIGLTGVLSALKTPFCESCDDWYASSGIVRLHSIADDEQLTDLRQAQTTEQLLRQVEQTDESANWLEYSLARCPECFQQAFLTVRKKTIKIDKKGNEDTKTETIWENVRIDPSEANMLEKEADTLVAKEDIVAE